MTATLFLFIFIGVLVLTIWLVWWIVYGCAFQVLLQRLNFFAAVSLTFFIWFDSSRDVFQTAA